VTIKWLYETDEKEIWEKYIRNLSSYETEEKDKKLIISCSASTDLFFHEVLYPDKVKSVLTAFVGGRRRVIATARVSPVSNKNLHDSIYGHAVA
jgi:hypothetical protein